MVTTYIIVNEEQTNKPCDMVYRGNMSTSTQSVRSMESSVVQQNRPFQIRKSVSISSWMTLQGTLLVGVLYMYNEKKNSYKQMRT